MDKAIDFSNVAAEACGAPRSSRRNRSFGDDYFYWLFCGTVESLNHVAKLGRESQLSVVSPGMVPGVWGVHFFNDRENYLLHFKTCTREKTPDTDLFIAGPDGKFDQNADPFLTLLGIQRELPVEDVLKVVHLVYEKAEDVFTGRRKIPEIVLSKQAKKLVR